MFFCRNWYVASDINSIELPLRRSVNLSIPCSTTRRSLPWACRTGHSRVHFDRYSADLILLSFSKGEGRCFIQCPCWCIYHID